MGLLHDLDDTIAEAQEMKKIKDKKAEETEKKLEAEQKAKQEAEEHKNKAF